MRKLLSLFIFVSLSQSAYSTSTDVLKTTAPKKEEAPAKKEETPTTIHKIEEKKTININNNTNFEAKQKSTQKKFCGKKPGECEKSCNKWLKAQKKSLGKKLLTATCEDERFLYGSAEGKCSAYVCDGEVEYIIK